MFLEVITDDRIGKARGKWVPLILDENCKAKSDYKKTSHFV